MIKPTFKGIWIPDFIVEMVMEKELTPTDMTLLAIIFSMSKRNEGCYASREYLAEVIGMSEGTIKNLISKYRKMGLVIDGDFDGRRQKIKTCWDFNPESKLRQPSRRNDGSRHVEMTPQNPSGDPEENWGHVEMTADQAINNKERGSNRKSELKLGPPTTFSNESSWKSFALENQILLLNSIMTTTSFTPVNAASMVTRLDKAKVKNKLETAYHWIYTDVIEGRLSAQYYDFTECGGSVVNNMPKDFQTALKLMDEHLAELEKAKPGFIKSMQIETPKYDF